MIFLVDKDFTNLDTIKKWFSKAKILLCIFHVLKFIRTLTSTAYATIEQKRAIFGKFKLVLYSRNEEIYERCNADLIQEIGDIQVRQNDTYISFKDYYCKNWEASAPMWVKFYRSGCPLLGDHTTNRIERMFWSLKQSLNDTFVSLSNTSSCIIHVMKFSDNRLRERYSYNALKTLKIFDQNEFIRKLNEESADHLNDRGCIVFHQMLKVYEERKGNLSPCLEGVVERFSSGENIYHATSTSCDCTYSKEYQSPCRHIIFQRSEVENIHAFDKDLFHPRYHRCEDHSFDIPTQVTGGNNDDSFNSDVVDPYEDESDVTEVVLTDRQKYNMIMPKLVKIGNLISCHSTNQFFQYLEDLEKFEKSVRRGQRFRFSNNEDDSVIVDTTVIADRPGSLSPDAVQSEAPASNSLPNTVSSVEAQSTSLLGNSTPSEEQTSIQSRIETNTRFNSMTFKQGLKTKGRPKGMSKQVTFNKTALDRGKVSKKKSKKASESFKSLVQSVSNELTPAQDIEGEYSGSTVRYMPYSDTSLNRLPLQDYSILSNDLSPYNVAQYQPSAPSPNYSYLSNLLPWPNPYNFQSS